MSKEVTLTLEGHVPAEGELPYPGGASHATELYPDRDAYALAFDWLDTLPKGAYPAIDRFVRDGHCRPTDELATQLNDACNEHRPPRPDGTSAALVRLMDLIGGGHPDETARVEL